MKLGFNPTHEGGTDVILVYHQGFTLLSCLPHHTLVPAK